MKSNKKFKKSMEKIEFFEVANTVQKKKQDNRFAANQISLL